MATASQWVQASRPKTLPASLAPVIAGIGAAVGLGHFNPLASLLALLLALSLQVAVNFSNDYSDGVRGTDSKEKRVGPLRLTGAGLVAPRTMLIAALAFYALGAICGLALVLLSGRYWLLALGVAALLAGWFYTGGKHPYGYFPGIAEIMVFFFFGLMATAGTLYLQLPANMSLADVPVQVWLGSSALGLYSCALLMANNLRDLHSDAKSGKRTFSVLLGESMSRHVFSLYFIFAVLAMSAALNQTRWPYLPLVVGVITGIIVSPVVARVERGARGPQLINVLKQTGLITLLTGLILSLGWGTLGF